jgi:hypothetical protein
MTMFLTVMTFVEFDSLNDVYSKYNVLSGHLAADEVIIFFKGLHTQTASVV